MRGVSDRGFESAAKGDNVFRDLVLARIIEPTSKIDAERVLTEVGVEPISYATLKRRLPIYAQPWWRQSLPAASARRARLGPASLVLFDVSTLYFETDAGDGFREPGFPRHHRGLAGASAGQRPPLRRSGHREPAFSDAINPGHHRNRRKLYAHPWQHRDLAGRARRVIHQFVDKNAQQSQPRTRPQQGGNRIAAQRRKQAHPRPKVER